MLIQIYGAGFHNRGAQLMLWTTIQKIKAINPDVRVAVEATRSTYKERAAYDLLTLVPVLSDESPRKTKFLGGVLNATSRLLPSSLEKFGLVRRCDVDALIDISGYAYGDKWGVGSARGMLARVTQFAKQGKPVVFLPQMLGPFENAEKRKVFQGILSNASLLYARDRYSMEAVEAINLTGKPIGLAPDITIFCDPLAPEKLISEPYACLVPNMRMRDKAGATWGEDYMKAMVRAGQRLKELNIRPLIVVHDGGGEDIVMAKELADKLGMVDKDILTESDPRRIKGYLAGGVMTIGSRFHALVSSLSSGVPVVSLGWAYKYEALMEDFGVEEYFCRHTDGIDGALPHIEKIASKSVRDELVEMLKMRKKQMEHRNQEMWEEVAAALNI